MSTCRSPNRHQIYTEFLVFGLESYLERWLPNITIILSELQPDEKVSFSVKVYTLRINIQAVQQLRQRLRLWTQSKFNSTKLSHPNEKHD